MKYALVVFVILVSSLSCGRTGDGDTVKLVGSGILVDVRTAEEYEAGHLKDAINIPHIQIGDKIAEYVKDKDERITVYCRSGRRSGIAKKVLVSKGYKHVVDTGAYEELKAQENRREEEMK